MSWTYHQNQVVLQTEDQPPNCHVEVCNSINSKTHRKLNHVLGFGNGSCVCKRKPDSFSNGQHTNT